MMGCLMMFSSLLIGGIIIQCVGVTGFYALSFLFTIILAIYAKPKRKKKADTKDQDPSKAEASEQTPKAMGGSSKTTMSTLDQSWDMHVSSSIFGIDDYSGFSGFGKGPGGGGE